MCAKNYGNWLAVDKVIAKISRLTFLAHGRPPCINRLVKYAAVCNCSCVKEMFFFSSVYSVCLFCPLYSGRPTQNYGWVGHSAFGPTVAI